MIEKVRSFGSFFVKILIYISIALVFVIGYFHFTKSYRQIDLESYTSEVELTDIKYEKKYQLPGLYSTKQELDKIVFDLEYFYKDRKYKSKAIIYWENVPLGMERIIDNNEIEKLIVKCNNEEPEKVMVFVKL